MFAFQLYNRRKRHLKGQEQLYWDSIDPSYMSEESTHESGEEVVVHKHTPPFRSEGETVCWVHYVIMLSAS